MRRPRWHDVLLVLALAVIAAGGVWAFWGKEVREEVRRAFGLEPEPVEKAPAAGAS